MVGGIRRGQRRTFSTGTITSAAQEEDDDNNNKINNKKQ